MKKMIQKTIIISAAFLFIMMIVSIKSKAAEEWEADGVHYIFDNGTLTISGKGAACCYAYEDKTTKIIVKEGFTSVKENGFCTYHKVKSIVLPSSVKSIGAYAFSDCARLESLVIPNGVKTVSLGMFAR